MKELDRKMSNMSIDDMDDLIGRFDKVKISKKDEDTLDSLIGSISSLKIGSKKEKKKMLIKGMKERKRRMFAKKYKNLSGKKVELNQKQIDDIFATMDALKKQNGSGKKKYQKGGVKMSDLPKDIEKIVLNYKKQLEKTNKKQIQKIDDLFRKWDELDTEYEETREEDLANERDDIYMEMKELVKKYLKNKGDFKKLQLSSNWKKSDFK